MTEKKGKEGLFGIGGLAIGGLLGYLLRGKSGEAVAPTSEVKSIASRIKVETVWPDQIYTLSNEYLLHYIGWPENFGCYLYACLLQDSNVDCLFSINMPNPAAPEPTWAVEFTRMAAWEQRIYFDEGLVVTFPAYTPEAGVPMLGYYIIEIAL